MEITYYSPPNTAFTDLYIAARKKENRFYSHEEIAALPDLPKTHSQYREWQMRKKSADRFISYLKNRKTPLHILEIGCGNGWFSNLMATIPESTVTGTDINPTELAQAAAIFKKGNLSFACFDLFEKTALHEQKFDIIVFNSCFQYFENAVKTIAAAKELLTAEGEIHLIDTPLYREPELSQARRRTIEYYEKLGFPEMAAHYFHHRVTDLGGHDILYNPNKLVRLLTKDSPFPWIRISKQKSPAES
jgi:SAM-dependent methyltransferase